MFIYKITDSKTNKSYIGKTERTVEERFKEHKKNHYLFKNIYKKDKYRLTVEVVDTCETLEELNKLEKKYIKEFDTMVPNGFNRVKGGTGGDTSNYIDYSKRTYSPKGILYIELDEDTQTQIIETYLSENTLSLKDIGQIYGVSPYVVKRTLDEHNIKRRQWKRKVGNRLIEFSKEDQDRIVSLYKQGNSQSHIGRMFGVTQGVIKRILVENKVIGQNEKVRRNYN